MLIGSHEHADEHRRPTAKLWSYSYLAITLLLASDVHQNPGPNFNKDNARPFGVNRLQGTFKLRAHNETKGFHLFKTANHEKLLWDSRSKPKGLLMGHLNIRSVASKTEQLEQLLTNSNFDLLCLSETWLTESSPNTAYLVPGYKVFRKDRKFGKGGGLLMYVKDCIKCKEIEFNTLVDIEYIAVTIVLSPCMTFTVVGIYRPPSSNSMFYDHLRNLLKGFDRNRELILVGDFNINWNEKSNRKKLQEIVSHFDLVQLIQGPTRITPSSETQIDLIFSNKPERITKSINLLTGLSDHNLILVVRKLTKHRFLYQQDKENVLNIIPKRLKNEFEEEFKKLDWNEILSTDNLEAASECLMVTINKIKGEFSKNVTFSRKKQNLPWLNEQLWKLMRQRDHALKIAIKSGLAHDRRTFQHLRNKVVKELRKAKANFFIDLINDAKGNSREVWENINRVRKKNYINDKGIELQVHGSLIQDKHQIASVFNHFFIDPSPRFNTRIWCEKQGYYITKS